MVTKVENVTPEGSTPTRRYSQEIKKFVRLGKEVKISPKANACVNKPGHVMEFFVPSVSVNIGIGRDHTADLVMTEEAWKALKAGEDIHITTTEEFKKML